MKNIFSALLIAAFLSACGGGGDDVQGPQDSPLRVGTKTFSAVPNGTGMWSVSYPDVERIASTCFPSASLFTFTNVQGDGHSSLTVDGHGAGDPLTVLTNLPSCPALT